MEIQDTENFMPSKVAASIQIQNRVSLMEAVSIQNLKSNSRSRSQCPSKNSRRLYTPNIFQGDDSNSKWLKPPNDMEKVNWDAT